MRLVSCVLFLTTLVPFTARGNLQPEEVAVIANRASRESRAVAAYYAKRRNIPSENIAALDMPTGEVISRQDWEQRVRPAVREWLEQDGRRERIRCLVTVWDVPLKISHGPTDSVRQRAAFLQQDYERRLQLLRQQVTAMQTLAPDSRPDQPPADETTDSGKKPPTPLEQLKTELQATLATVQNAAQALAPEERQQTMQRLQQLVVASAGSSALVTSFANSAANSTMPAEMKSTFDILRGQVRGLSEARAIIESLPMTLRSDLTALACVDRTHGLVGSLDWIQTQRDVLKKNETGASFDSELSLVWWPDYELLRWQPNYLNMRFDGSTLRELFSTLMVARLEAPTLPLTKQLIDVTLEVEAAGLQGRIYLDGRGIAKKIDQPVENGTYADYDRALLLAERDLKQLDRLDVVTDNQPALFQPGDCPDAALYCGWYSLAKYVDAFEWSPGAVAYHMASSEAVTLRKADSQVWCKRMLEEGVCATVGPVYEPYLAAFPRPNEFFPRLLQGNETLVEVYYRTKPFNSWMMVLVGDPLYRPFAK